MYSSPDSGMSRRCFLKGAGASAVGLATLDSRTAAADMLAGPEAASKDGIRRMGGNENPVGPSPMAIDAVAEQLAGLNWYPYQPDLPLAIHRYHSIDVETSEGIGWAGLKTTFVKESRVITGIGSTEVLRAAAWAYLMEGGHVVQAMPSYDEVPGAGEKLGERVTITSVPLTSEHRVDLAAIRDAVRLETRIISVCNPNNPTGTLLTHDEIGDFIDRIDPRILIVIDEAYIHYVKDRSYEDATIFAKTRPNVLVTRTFSKAYGIAGLRVGYGIAHPDVINKMKRYTLGPLGMHSNSIAGASAALQDQSHMDRSRSVTISGRDYLIREMSDLGWKPISGECNFVLADSGQDSRKVFEHLLSRKILVTPGTRWNMPTFIRVSVGMPEDNEAFITAIKEL